MNERDDPIKVERILVAFDTTPLGETALEAAAGLATAFDAELTGLFVEDVNLMRMAQLPFTRELGLTSAVIRPIEATDIERVFRMQAARIRISLETLALELDLRWSFQVVRGQAFAAVLECTRERDLVVFGETPRVRIAASARPSAAGMAPGGAAPQRGERFRQLGLRPVALLFDGSERALRALAAAHALAATAQTRLALLVPAESAEEFGRLRELAKAWLSAHGATARFLWLRRRDVPDVAQAVRAENAAVLLWHGGASPEDRRRARALLSALACPVVLMH
jgi:nucleotide-binding universal stress UspA family protein